MTAIEYTVGIRNADGSYYRAYALGNDRAPITTDRAEAQAWLDRNRNAFREGTAIEIIERPAPSWTSSQPPAHEHPLYPILSEFAQCLIKELIETPIDNPEDSSAIARRARTEVAFWIEDQGRETLDDLTISIEDANQR